jgi:hypothetical protein
LKKRTRHFRGLELAHGLDVDARLDGEWAAAGHPRQKLRVLLEAFPERALRRRRRRRRAGGRLILIFEFFFYFISYSLIYNLLLIIDFFIDFFLIFSKNNINLDF